MTTVPPEYSRIDWKHAAALLIGDASDSDLLRTIVEPLILSSRMMQCWIIVVALFLISQIKADCADPPPLREVFQGTTKSVARLELLLFETEQLSCGLEVYVDDETGGSEKQVVNELPVYRVLEVFQGNLTKNATLPLVLDTDTGRQLAVPSRLTAEATDGFLAFLNPLSDCGFPDYQELVPITYYLSDCDYTANMRWQDVSDEDKMFLRGMTSSVRAIYGPWECISLLLATIVLASI